MLTTKNLINHQRRIGLTGGIASGKSTIANYISSMKKITILDADIYSRKLIQSGTKPYSKLIAYFGETIIEKNSRTREINRNLLKKIIFNNHDKRIWLENLLHPLIREEIIYACSKKSKDKILLLVIPLLFEANFIDLCTEIWLVKCSKQTQIKRLIERDKINEYEAKKIIDLQISFKDKEKKSDFILDNESDQNQWKKKVNELI